MSGEYVTIRTVDFDKLLMRLDQIDEKLDFVSLTCKLPETIDVGDIAKLKGISRTQLTEKERYLLPNFGVSQYPGSHARWDYAVYEAWNSRPIGERKLEYEAVLEAERKKRIQEKERSI